MNELKKLDVEALEKDMLSFEQAPCPVLHHFGNGVYVRELRMNAGTLAVGHRQKHKHLNIFLQGRVAIYTDDGVNTLQAPMIFEGEPGRKVGYVLEDIVWLNVYPNEDGERDIDTLEEKWLDKTTTSQEVNADPDRQHFLETISDLGFSEETVWEQSVDEDDLIPFPEGYDVKLSVRNSAIHGKGLFSNGGFEEGEVIAPARLDGMRTPAGRYTNHAKSPNAKFEKLPNGDILLVAQRTILPCHGGSKGEEITVDYRQAFEVNSK